MMPLRTLFRIIPVRVIGIGLLVGLTVIFCRQLGLLETLELGGYDWTVRLAPAPVSPGPRIVLIAITDGDYDRFGPWPISDSNIAQALKILTEYGASAIGLDLYRDKEVPPGTSELHDVLARHRGIITVRKFPDQHGRGVPGPAVLEGTDQIGFNDILVDPGGIVRRSFLFLEDQHGIATSFSLLLALRYLEQVNIVPQPDPTHPEFIRLGKTTIPPFQSNDGSYVDSDARGYQMLVKFSSMQDSFERYTLAALLSGEVSQDAIRDAIVVLGSASESVRDDFYTPFSLVRDRQQQVAGMELHAHFVNQFLRIALNHESPVRSLSESVEVGWILLWGLLGALLASRLVSPWPLIFLLGGGMATITIVAYWAYLAGWWVPMVPPMISWLVAGGATTAWLSHQNKTERRMLMEFFSRHVSHEVAETIWRKRDQILQEGRIRPQKLTATVLFADLEGFSSVAEHLPPQDLMDWLNTYLTSIADVISAHRGVVDDFFGDGVKANFGVPFARIKEDDIRQDARNAVQCGLAIIRDMNRINRWNEQRAIPLGNVRIGIATGPVVVGNVGSAQRLKYTTVGDVVNVAARLEQLGKARQIVESRPNVGSLLITEETKNYLDARWETQDVGKVELEGRHDPVSVYRVLRGPFQG